MAKKTIHTVPHGDGWAVKESGKEKPLSTHRSKDAAVDRGAKIAEQKETEHVIHRRDGTIQDKDSYGNDPHPPKDKKH